MKLNKIFAAFMLIMAVAFAACEPIESPVGPGSGNNGGNNNGGTDNGGAVVADTTGWNIPAGCLTVAEARAICAGLTTGDSTSTEEYYVMGWVKKTQEVSATYGNATFFMEDVKGANSKDDFTAYRVKGLNGANIAHSGAVAAGDFVVIYGKLKNYKGTYENASGAYIWKSTNPNIAGKEENTGNGGTGGSTTDSDITVPENALVFDADTDKGNATTDYNQAGAFQITKDGVTVDVTKGCLGTYNNELHYRIYKNQTLTITSTTGNIKEIVFTCTTEGTNQYGPGCFTVDGGKYVYSGANGQWTGDAETVTFTASSNQVRATQIAVVVE